MVYIIDDIVEIHGLVELIILFVGITSDSNRAAAKIHKNQHPAALEDTEYVIALNPSFAKVIYN